MRRTSQPRQIVVWGGGYLDNHRKPEDLKRFNKHRKQKQILFGFIIAIIMIIGGISLYRSFAMYEEKKTFDVLKGTIPDFSNNDITLAFTVDGKPVSGKFFEKNGGYIGESVSCENKVTAEWDNDKWGLERIKNPQNVSKIKCNVNFVETYKENLLNGADPVLGEGMVAVKINESNGEVTKADVKVDWYKYQDQRWANAVILANGKTGENYKEGDVILEEDIESYFVWIPKYKYQLFDEQVGKYTTTSTLKSKDNLSIDIQFGLENTEDKNGECATPMLSNKVQGESGGEGDCQKGEYMTHPAFLAFGGNGFWVGKFEASKKDTNRIQIKPKITSWRNIMVGDSFRTALDYRPNLESHMMKNTEWGAVAYLTQSIYGRCDGKGTCTKTAINSNSNYLTGYTNATAYGGNNAQLASTTGNYTGVYDMSGGAWEQMASVMKSADGSLMVGGSGLETSELNDPKYYDVYEYSAARTNWNQRILGDATGELGPFGHVTDYYYSSMYGDFADFVDASYPWFYRGGYFANGSTRAGVFAFGRVGNSPDYRSFRVVLMTD